MTSLKTTFTRAATGNHAVSLYALALLALAIDDDRQQRDKDRRNDRRRRRERDGKPVRKRPSGPHLS